MCEKKHIPNVTYVAGALWGDEGKGKVVTELCKDADLVIRATGGANAGHSIVYNGEKIGLHLFPCGIVNPNVICLIGQGVAFDPAIFIKELELLEEKVIHAVSTRIKISGRAGVVMPFHKNLDVLHEKAKDTPIGTTKRGIGPSYSDYDNRFGIRVYDLLLPKEKLIKKLKIAQKIHNPLLEAFGMQDCCLTNLDCELLATKLKEYAYIIKDMVVNGDELIDSCREEGTKILIEGAQGWGLDKYHGAYPDVTPSNPVTAGALLGAHLTWNDVRDVVMVSKAYASRVGNGPFPTELPAHIENDSVIPYLFPYYADIIREEGHEFGVTSGRARRVGWADAVALKTAGKALGATCQCINHVDTLGKLGQIFGGVKICTSYGYQGKNIDRFPDDIELTEEIPTPFYYTINGGWVIPDGIESFEELPNNAKEFINVIEEVTGVPVKYIGIGPEDEDLIVREDI